jgi:acetyltransferase-like isoleucine patch superfamily enzyme
MTPQRTLEWDWHPGTVPGNVELDEAAYLETTYSFTRFSSTAPAGVRIGRGSSVYLGTMFDLGPWATVEIGEHVLLNGARIICDSRVEIGDHTLISWNVVLMDTYRVPLDPRLRREALEQAARGGERVLQGTQPGAPIRIGANVWIGFDVCILPGVTIGDGSIIGARSVVVEDVPPYSVAAGNPARVVRQLPNQGVSDGG